MRVHWFEFEDQSWFPAPLRVAMTAYLVAAYSITPFPKLWAERLSTVLTPGQLNAIIDLGSGSGGPIRAVASELATLGYPVSITLTDLYPNGRERDFPPGDGANIRYWPDPVDATHVPPTLSGVRTMFASLHHCRPAAVLQILRNAADQRQPICIFEATARKPLAIVLCLLIPLLVLVLTPKVQPLSWFQVVFTYLVPILPLLIFWDGLVSNLRTYHASELEAFARTLPSADYRWESGELAIPGNPLKVPYLIGRPVTPAS